MAVTRTRTEVVVVGGGPAGLLLSHLLHVAGIESTVLDTRSVTTIEATHRAGILENDSVAVLVGSGGSDRVLRDGHEHEGVQLRFGGLSHRVDFQAAVGASCWLYPQTEVFVDLHRSRTRDHGELRYGLRSTRILDTASPRVEVIDADGRTSVVEADLVVGADGSHSSSRDLVAGRRMYTREYPFAWFGIMVEAPPSAPELVYTRSERGFVLLSQRTESLQRMYFQCSPDDDADDWSDDRIWDEMTRRLAGHDDFALRQGKITDRAVLPFRSFVQTPMAYQRLVLAGDAAHTVPPTGAKGLNLALADARVLAEEVERLLRKGDEAALGAYTDRALARVWKAQHFSFWMTSMLHRADASSDFDDRRQQAELSTLVASDHGRAYLAECYTGWPTLPHPGTDPDDGR